MAPRVGVLAGLLVLSAKVYKDPEGRLVIVVLAEVDRYDGAGFEVNIPQDVGKGHDIVHERQAALIDFE